MLYGLTIADDVLERAAPRNRVVGTVLGASGRVCAGWIAVTDSVCPVT